MATVHISLTQVQERATTGATIPVPDSIPAAAQTMTSSGTSAQSTITASSSEGVWVVTAKGGDIWVAFGANPTAAQGAGYLVLAGTTRDFGINAVGDKIAIKDA